MNIGQDGSTVGAMAGKARVRATRCLMGAVALGTVFATIAGAGLASEKEKWQRRTDSAYFAVYSYHCAPTFFKSVAKERPDGMEVTVVESRFHVDYQGSCRAFYLTEIAPRIVAAAYGLVIISRD